MACSAFSRIQLLAVFALAVSAEGHDLTAKSKFTIKDKVFVDGALFAESAALGDNLMCHTHTGTSKFKVCGCGVKVVAHLLSECQTYEKYDEQVGHCDCGSAACDEKTLTSGYSEPFEWKATSFEISAC